MDYSQDSGSTAPGSAPLLEWFQDASDEASDQALGFRRAPGGMHLSKTLMFAGLETLLDELPTLDKASLEHAVLDTNVLGKRTGSARRLALAQLNALYGLALPSPIQAAALFLARRAARHGSGRRLAALLCALAREPLLRVTAGVVLRAPPGASIRWPDLAAPVAMAWPGRYSPKMLRSLSQNCASTWTQSGHLRGKVAKRRALVVATPDAAAYAALLGTLAGFGGPALLRSPWMRVLDSTEEQLIHLLRRAEAVGLARVRAGGGVVQVDVRGPFARALEVPALGDG